MDTKGLRKGCISFEYKTFMPCIPGEKTLCLCSKKTFKTVPIYKESIFNVLVDSCFPLCFNTFAST